MCYYFRECFPNTFIFLQVRGFHCKGMPKAVGRASKSHFLLLQINSPAVLNRHCAIRVYSSLGYIAQTLHASLYLLFAGKIPSWECPTVSCSIFDTLRGSGDSSLSQSRLRCLDYNKREIFLRTTRSGDRSCFCVMVFYLLCDLEFSN